MDTKSTDEIILGYEIKTGKGVYRILNIQQKRLIKLEIWND